VSSSTATPVTWSAVGNWKTYSGFDGQASELDKTNLSSTAKEFALGIVDYGMLQLEFDQDNADTGQAAMLSAYAASASKSFKITLPNAATATFTGYVRKFTSAGGVDQIVKRQADIRISGAVTWA
jgi:Lambda phage tail tube protein, TTP